MDKDFAASLTKMSVQIIAKTAKCGRLTIFSEEVENTTELHIKPSRNLGELYDSVRVRYNDSTMGDGQIKLSVGLNKDKKEVIIYFR